MLTLERVIPGSWFLAVFVSVATGCSVSTKVDPSAFDDVDAIAAALSTAQCDYFAVDGRIQICHATASGTNPYTILKVSEQACANAHAAHADDYVAIDDPTCGGGGCLPGNAPCDATVPCCEGLECASGVCAAAGATNGSGQFVALSFQWMSTPDTAALSVTGDLTLEGWVRPAATPASSNNQMVVVSKQLACSACNGRSYSMAVRWEGSSSVVQFNVSADGVIGNQVDSSPLPAFVPNVWRHVAVSLANGIATFYVDGVAAGTVSGLPLTINDSADPLHIGGTDPAPDAPESGFWDGNLAEVRVWNSARSEAEIAGARTIRLGPTPGLVGYWPLAGGVEDASGNGQDLTLANGASFAAPSPF